MMRQVLVLYPVPERGLAQPTSGIRGRDFANLHAQLATPALVIERGRTERQLERAAATTDATDIRVVIH